MRKCLTTISLIAASLSAAAADEIAAFTDIAACRLDAERVLLSATFETGACDEYGPADLAEPRGTIVAVTLPATRTAEMCTMQVVSYYLEQVIAAPEPVADLDVTALDATNEPIAHAVVPVADPSETCTPPLP